MSRRFIVHASILFSADFLMYNDHGRRMLVVHGDDLPVDGEVDEVIFRELLKDIRAKEKARCRVKYAEKKAITESKFDPAHDGYTVGRTFGDGFGDVQKALCNVNKKTYPMTKSEWAFSYWA